MAAAFPFLPPPPEPSVPMQAPSHALPPGSPARSDALKPPCQPLTPPTVATPVVVAPGAAVMTGTAVSDVSWLDVSCCSGLVPESETLRAHAEPHSPTHMITVSH